MANEEKTVFDEMKEQAEQMKAIAAYVEDKTPDAVRRRIKLVLIGITIGIILCCVIIIGYIKYRPTKYITYITFYIQEKGGVRPASIHYPGTITTTADLEAVESMLLKKYDNGKIQNIMLFGTPIVLKVVEEPVP
jgi:hypothetical protein